MVYILSGEREGDIVGAFRRYEAYLRSVEALFPPSAFGLAISDWYFNLRDHRSPHDAWVEAVEFQENGSGDRRQNRDLTIKLTLLGAYHDGTIEITYARVLSYAMNSVNSAGGHGDWLYDEFRLTPRGTVIHEIEFQGRDAKGLWLIEASDVVYRWIATP